MKYKWTQKKQTLEVFSIRRKWNTSTKPNLFKAVHGGEKKIHILDIHVSWSLFELQNMKCH